MSGKEQSLDKIARRLAGALRPLSAEKRVSRIMEEYSDRVAVATNFGPTSAVLLHMASSIFPGVRVINVRHGYETEETLTFAGECQQRFNISLRIYNAPKLSIPEWGTTEFEEFCRLVKIDPMQRALKAERIALWLAGLVHTETVERRRMRIAQQRLGAIAVYPIIDWIKEDAVRYCHAFRLGTNANYFDPCKGPHQKLECGLHLATESHVGNAGRA